MMSELRKYGVGLTLAHQHLHQLKPEIRHAVLGNAGTLVTFRVGAEDAPYLAKEFQLTFDVQDLISLPNHNVYLRLMIDGEPSMPFSAGVLRTNDFTNALETKPDQQDLVSKRLLASDYVSF